MQSAKYKSLTQEQLVKKKQRSKAWTTLNANKVNEIAKKSHLKNKDKNNKRCREYNKLHRKQITEQEKTRRKTDVQFRLLKTLRARVKDAAKHGYVKGSYRNYLGCSAAQLRKWLQLQFQPGMSWDNQGLHGWHIDHIRPLASFNLAEPIHLAEACHYMNLQPLWAKDNLTKGGRWVKDLT
jgi:hypothetical protein